MALGDKYHRFTQYLQMKHAEGMDSITLTFPEIEKSGGFLSQIACTDMHGQMIKRRAIPLAGCEPTMW